MNVSLNTLCTADGLELSDADGTHIFTIIYKQDGSQAPSPWRYFVIRTEGKWLLDPKAWRSSEAAGFYALALHADDIERDKRERDWTEANKSRPCG